MADEGGQRRAGVAAGGAMAVPAVLGTGRMVGGFGCYNSTEIMHVFPAGDQTANVLQMYLFSTLGIAASMFAAALAWKRHGARGQAVRRYGFGVRRAIDHLAGILGGRRQACSSSLRRCSRASAFVSV
ncbi:MAG: hypothetical protein ACLSVD_02290 [Eggerthellaceae bacterium]